LVCKVLGHRWVPWHETLDDAYLGAHGVQCSRCGYFIELWRD
jgi:hypothetical protein